MKKTCIIIAGPTAVGKTAIAIDVAKHFSSKIISADSRQCFKELNIGVAKPSAEELKSVEHFFIDVLSVKDDLSAADFESYALKSLDNIFLKHDIAVITGGTGLYIKAFCEGLDEIPPADEAIRKMISKHYNEQGIDYLINELERSDPVFYKTGEMQNPQRMIRALEVLLSTGKSITCYQTRQKKRRDFDIIKIGLELPRAALYDRINKRVDNMMEAGLADEVRSLMPFKHLNALQTVGYRELFDYFDGNISMQHAIELIKQHTRQYAKRQMTWFKRDEEMNWCSPEKDEIIKMIEGKILTAENIRQ